MTARRIARDDASGSSVGLEENGPYCGFGERSGGPKPARGAVFLDALEKQNVSGALHLLGEESVVRPFLN